MIRAMYTDEQVSEALRLHDEWLAANRRGRTDVGACFKPRNVRFMDGQLGHGVLKGVEFVNCDFSSGTISFDPEECTFTNCSFKGSRLGHLFIVMSEFYGCDFTGATFISGQWKRGLFEDCTFYNAEIRGVYNVTTTFVECSGLHDLGVLSHDSYRALCVVHQHEDRADDLYIACGCRWLIMEEAVRHWNKNRSFGNRRAREMQYRMKMARNIHKLEGQIRKD